MKRKRIVIRRKRKERIVHLPLLPVQLMIKRRK
jgi:hypothetical protein